MTDCRPVDDDAIREAVRLLGEGHLAILPTDTVYGIVADVRRAEAVSAIPAAKGRDAGMPLQLLFDTDLTRLATYAVLPSTVSRLVEALGPGAWTIIAPAAKGWTSPALGVGRTVGFRIPAAPTVHRVVELLGAPVAASSANRHGQRSSTTCAAAVAEVGEFCAIALDGGPTVAGIDSTVIDCSGDEPAILREGAIDRQTVARILGLSHVPVIRSVRQ
jgi:L-threonylcarbamoyladenylate synthase